MQRIGYFFGLLIACFCVTPPSLAQTIPAPTTYLVAGRCHDYGTALGLKAHIYATIDGVQKKLGECRDVGKFEPMTGTFDVRVPATATQLQLVMPGYRTVTIPIQFASDIPAHARFTIGHQTEMTALDSLPKPTNQDGNLSLFFDIVDSLDVDVELRNTQDTKWLAQFSCFHNRPGFGAFALPFRAPASTYVLALSTRTGQRISTDTLRIADKLIFKSVRVIKPTEAGPASTTSLVTTISTPQAAQPASGSSAPPQTALLISKLTETGPAVTPPSSTTLYFDQSSHALRTQTKYTLDSIAQVLSSHPGLIVTLTGYSDNVGPQGPNLTLSEYRTRTVAKYLQQQHVPAHRITANWAGPAPGASSADADSIKARSRRVEVQVK